MNDEELSALIRHQATRHQASDSLRASVRTQIALQSAARTGQANRNGGNTLTATRWPWFGWRSAFSGLMAGMALMLAMVWLTPRIVQPLTLPDELVADHVRAMKVGPLFDVASSDRHTVKPWFQGKLDYSPQVIDLKAEGFPLLGGRVEHVNGAPTAALAYMRDRHVINVFVLASPKIETVQMQQRRGFNVLHWGDGSMQVWAVSDVEGAELQRFAAAWQATVAGR